MNSFAASTNHPGLYLGLQGGYGLSDEGDGYYKHLETFANHAIGNKSFDRIYGGAAGRIFSGYNFNKYFSVEFGGSLLPKNKYIYNNSSLPQYLSIKTETYTVDLVGKFILPLNSKWNVYAKLGGAYVHFKLNGIAQNIPGNNSNTLVYESLCPAYGLGLTYNVNKNIGIDLAWLGTYSNNRFFEKDLDPDAIKPVPTTNMFMLGIAYKFTRF